MTTQHSIKSLRAAFDDAPSGDKNRESNFGNYYPFWDMKPGQRCVVRFLPDVDTTNKRQFLIEQVFHNLTVNGKKTKVPCLSMYGEDCPVCKISQDYYKVEGKDSANGKKYWRKKQYIGQAIVVEDPLPANQETGETHAGKVRFLSLGFQIYNIIKEAFAEEDEDLALSNVPYAMQGGYDFVIKKSMQGEYSSYSTGTKFANKPRDLSEEELAVVSENMVELITLLPKNPGAEVIQAKLNADLNGEEYSGGSKAPAAKKAPARADADEDDIPVSKPAAKPAASTVSAESTDEGSSDVDDMLEQIRARRQGR